MIPAYKKRLAIAGGNFVAAYAAAVVGAVATYPRDPGFATEVARLLGMGAGIALLCTFWLYVKAKGRSGWWLLLLPLSVIGLAVLAFLKDREPASEQGAPQHGARQLLSRILLSSTQLLVALVAVCALYIGWMSWQGRQLRALCAEANEGIATSALPALADKYGFDRQWVEHGIRAGNGAGWVAFVPSSATMGDVSCEIHYDNTRVLSARMRG